jgi:methionyl-tRNA synthetase
MAPGHRCQAPQPLFPRIDTKKTLGNQTTMTNTENHGTSVVAAGDVLTAGESKPVPATAAVPADATADTTAASDEKALIEYADFAKIDLRVATVVEAERIPKADKLLKLQVELSGGERRQILAGIAQQYEPEQLIGKQIIVVANLAPRKMRGLESQGMLLAASPTAEAPPAALLTVGNEVPAGSLVR